MKSLKQQISGHLQFAGQHAVLLLDENTEPLFLRFALLTANLEQQILPAVLLDDWGHEIKSLEMYDWVRQNGLRFPRAELFGFDLQGHEVQYFLRDLDLMARYPCYAYSAAGTSLNEGRLLSSVCLPDLTIAEPIKIKRPAGIQGPLRYAKVSWWQAQPEHLANLPL